MTGDSFAFKWNRADQETRQKWVRKAGGGTGDALRLSRFDWAHLDAYVKADLRESMQKEIAL